MPRPKISAKNAGRACCHLVENDSAFRCIGSRLANHAGGRRRKERERSRTGGDNTSVSRRCTSSQPSSKDGQQEGQETPCRVSCDVRGSDLDRGRGFPMDEAFL